MLVLAVQFRCSVRRRIALQVDVQASQTRDNQRRKFDANFSAGNVPLIPFLHFHLPIIAPLVEDSATLATPLADLSEVLPAASPLIRSRAARLRGAATASPARHLNPFRRGLRRAYSFDSLSRQV